MKDKTAKELLNHVHEMYEKIAHEFDKTRKQAWPEFEKFQKYFKKNFSVLDLGCGNGRLYEYLKPLKYTGVDISEKLIKLAQRSHPFGVFKVGDQLNIPAKDQKFDMIFNIAAFHHIPSKKLRKKALNEMVRVLKKNGILIMTVWNLFQKKYWKYILKAAFISIAGKYEWNDAFIPWGEKKIPRYYHAFTKQELKKLFKKDFEVIEFKIDNNILAICRKKS